MSSLPDMLTKAHPRVELLPEIQNHMRELGFDVAEGDELVSGLWDFGPDLDEDADTMTFDEVCLLMVRMICLDRPDCVRGWIAQKVDNQFVVWDHDLPDMECIGGQVYFQNPGFRKWLSEAQGGVGVSGSALCSKPGFDSERADITLRNAIKASLVVPCHLPGPFQGWQDVWYRPCPTIESHN